LEAAYDAMLFCALAIFAARGYRVTAEKGHHTVALEGMAAELQLAQAHIDQIAVFMSASLTLRRPVYLVFRIS
jgi:hypothetical protein